MRVRESPSEFVLDPLFPEELKSESTDALFAAGLRMHDRLQPGRQTNV